jgi:hypothetical protein
MRSNKIHMWGIRVARPWLYGIAMRWPVAMCFVKMAISMILMGNVGMSSPDVGVGLNTVEMKVGMRVNVIQVKILMIVGMGRIPVRAPTIGVKRIFMIYSSVGVGSRIRIKEPSFRGDFRAGKLESVSIH